MINKVFHVFSSTKVTQGSQRALLQDIVNSREMLIPNSFAEFLLDNQNVTVASILAKYSAAEKAIATEYITWAVQNQYAVLLGSIEQANQLRTIDLAWDAPSSITNCIIEIRDFREDYLDKVLLQINQLRVLHIEVRVLEVMPLAVLILLLSKLQEMDISAANILMQYHESLSLKELKKALQYKLVLNSLVIFGSPVKKTKKSFLHAGNTAIVFSNQRLSHQRCGHIDIGNFSNNMEFFSEAKQHNTCLNRKVTIDAAGEIKNCPSMTKSYGNILDTTIGQAVNKAGFKDLWDITKDEIAICKDCEFRNVCTDCRAYLQNPGDLYSKPLKCGYNPYTNKWEDWSQNPQSKKAIAHYKFDEAL